MKRSTLSTPAALALGGAVSAAVMSLLYVIARERRATRELKAQLNQLLEDTRSKGADAPDSTPPSATPTTDRDRDTHVHTPGHASPGGRGRVVRATPPRRPKERRPSPLKPADRASATQLRSGTFPPAKHAGIVPGGHGRLPIPVPPPGSPSSSKPNLEQLQMLLSVTRLISEGARFSDVIQRVIDVATSVVNADRVTLFLVDKYMHRLRVAVSKGSLSRQHMHMRNVTLPIDTTSIAGSCAATGRSVIVNNAYADPRFDQSVDAQTQYKTETLLCVPLMNEESEVIGVVQAVNKLPPMGFVPEEPVEVVDGEIDTSPVSQRSAPAFFTAWDRALLEHIADFAGNELNKSQLYEQASEARQRTEKMFELMRTISAESDVEQMIQCIMNATISVVKADRVTMYLVDEEAQELIVSQSQDIRGARIPIQAGIAGHVARTGETLNIVDAHQDPRFDDSWDRKTNYRTRSMMCLPVKDQHGKVVACLQAINKVGPEEVFTQNDLRCLEYMAGNAGIMLRKAQLMRKQERAQRATEALLDVVKLVSSDHNIHELVEGIIQAAYSLLQADMVTLFLVDPIKQELWMAVSKDLSGNRIPLGRGIVGHVAQTGQVANVADAYEDPRFDPSMDVKSGIRTKSILCVPVCVTHGKPIAVIEAVTLARDVDGDAAAVRQRGFDETDVEALTAFSAEVALALNRKSVEAAFMKVLKDDRTSREQEFDVSLLTLYSDTNTTARLHTSVRVKAVEVKKAISWPTMASPQRGTTAYTSWNFDPFEQPVEKLMHVVKSMLDEFQLLSRFNVRAGVCEHFIMRVTSLYKDNPFHNFLHGFSVMHAVFLMLVQTNAAMCLSRLDIFSVLVASLCHDIDHPGHTNAFEVNSMSELALRHNDDAVLERHHAHTTFELLLRDPDSALFESLNKQDLRQVRKAILEGILATDMSKHVRMCEVLVGKINKGASSKRRFSTVHAFRDALSPPSAQPSRFGRRRKGDDRGFSSMPPPPFNKESAQDRLCLIEALVHTADLSGQCYPARIARKWGDRVIEEFTAQARREESLGMPVMPFMKNLTRPLDRARLQLRFVNQVVLPLWTAMNDLLHGLAVPVDNLYTNRMHYQAAVDRYEGDSDDDDRDDCDDAGNDEAKGGCPTTSLVSHSTFESDDEASSVPTTPARPPLKQQLSNITEEPRGNASASGASGASGSPNHADHVYDDFEDAAKGAGTR